MRIHYVTNDGKVFYTEKECVEYEKEQIKKEKNFFQKVIVFDYNLNPINTFRDLYFKKYVYIKDSQGLFLIKQEKLEDCFPTDIGMWVYNTECYHWDLAKNKIAECTDMIDKYQKLIDNLRTFINKATEI